ncbi:DUF4112 domain-containing protein [Hyphococcus sp.]|uniref:DUF4112 domain-containing protein n=1 Tax=Hyphococcus sp. TaxID=2038636 RepID=UPI0035C6F486
MSYHRAIDHDAIDRAAAENDRLSSLAQPHAAAKARVEWLATFLDARYRIPGLGYRFGWDSILGLVPGVGDAAAGLMSAYLIWEARRAGAGFGLVLRMIYNLLVDTILGAVPVFGDIFDFAFKANLRNAELLKEHYAKIEMDKAGL